MARSVTSRVLSRVAPSGSSNSTVKYPWSSWGRKLWGTSWAMAQILTMPMPNAANERFEWLRKLRMMRAYTVCPLASQRLMARNMKFLRSSSPSFFGLRNWAHITGLIVRATMVEMITETAMVMVNWR